MTASFDIAIVATMTMSAEAFMVTIYGDVVVPRGGALWTGTQIEHCSRVKINESLVRTAVSRLVAADSWMVNASVAAVLSEDLA